MINYLDLEQGLRNQRKYQDQQAKIAEEKADTQRKQRRLEVFAFESKKYEELAVPLRNFVQGFNAQGRKLDCGKPIRLLEVPPNAAHMNLSSNGATCCMRMEVNIGHNLGDRNFLKLRFISASANDGALSGEYEVMVCEMNLTRHQFEPFYKTALLGRYKTVEGLMLAVVTEISKR